MCMTCDDNGFLKIRFNGKYVKETCPECLGMPEIEISSDFEDRSLFNLGDGGRVVERAFLYS